MTCFEYPWLTIPQKLSEGAIENARLHLRETLCTLEATEYWSTSTISSTPAAWIKTVNATFKPFPIHFPVSSNAVEYVKCKCGLQCMPRKTGLANTVLWIQCISFRRRFLPLEHTAFRNTYYEIHKESSCADDRISVSIPRSPCCTFWPSEITRCLNYYCNKPSQTAQFHSARLV